MKYRRNALDKKELLKWHPNQLSIDQEIKGLSFPLRIHCT